MIAEETTTEAGGATPRLDSDTRFFRDGLRRIDFILAYVEDGDSEEELRKKRDKRLEFERNLQVWLASVLSG